MASILDGISIAVHGVTVLQFVCSSDPSGLPAEAGIGLTVIVAAAVVMGILCIATALACFVRGPGVILEISKSYGFADRRSVSGGVRTGSSGIVIVDPGLLLAYMHCNAYSVPGSVPIMGEVGFNALGNV